MNEVNPKSVLNQAVTEDWLRLMDQFTTPFMICDSRGYIRYANESLRGMLGYDLLALQQKPLWKFLTSPSEYDEQRLIFAQVLSKQLECRRYDSKWIPRQGQPIKIHWSYGLWQGDSGENFVAGLGWLQDEFHTLKCVLNCDRAQDLATSRQTLKALQTLATSTGTLTDNAFYNLCVEQLATIYQTRYAMIAKLEDPTRLEICALAMCDRNCLLPNFHDLVHGTPHQNVLVGQKILVTHGLLRRYPENAMLQKMRAESYFGVPLLDENHNVVGLVAVIDDKPFASNPATESLLPLFAQRIAQEMIQHHQNTQIRRHQARLQLLVDSTTDILWESDDQGILRYLSPRCDQIFNRPAAELYGQPFWSPLSANSIAEVRLWFTQGGPLRDMEVNAIDPNGRQHYLELSAVALGKDLGGGYLGVYRDISERRWRETERLQRSKLETLGQLTSSIAHDLNNLLTVIQGSLELMDWDSEQDQELLTDALSASRNGSQLIRQLLGFARHQPLERQAIDLTHFFQTLLGFTRHMVRHPVTFTSQIEDALPTVYADRSALEGALMNLIVNARHSINQEGHILLKVSKVFLDSPQGHCSAGNFVCFQIQDNGSGMDAQTLTRACEPFFTTKPSGQGTGLGLSSAMQFFRQSQGDLQIQSTLGQGTTVACYLPVATQSQTSEVLAVGGCVLARGNETLLLAEDRDELRSFLCNALTKLGYTVLLATNSQMAQQQLADKPQIALLISDLSSQNGLNSEQFYQWTQRHYPHLRMLIITTGFETDSTQLETNPTHYLYKPFSLSDLATKLRQLLG